MTSLTYLTECPVCMQQYTQTGNKTPKLLKCGHTVCLECGELLCRGRDRFRCPYCRKNIHTPVRGFASLPNNITIISVLDCSAPGSCDGTLTNVTACDRGLAVGVDQLTQERQNNQHVRANNNSEQNQSEPQPGIRDEANEHSDELDDVDDDDDGEEDEDEEEDEDDEGQEQEADDDDNDDDDDDDDDNDDDDDDDGSVTEDSSDDNDDDCSDEGDDDDDENSDSDDSSDDGDEDHNGRLDGSDANHHHRDQNHLHSNNATTKRR